MTFILAIMAAGALFSSKGLPAPGLVHDRSQAGKWTHIGQAMENDSGEASVIYDSVNNVFHAWYSKGPLNNVYTYHCTSTNGIFTTGSAVIGHGLGGCTGDSSRQNTYFENGIYYNFHSDLTDSAHANQGGNLILCTSTDGSTFTLSGTAIPMTSGTGICNSRILKSGSTYYLFGEKTFGTGSSFYTSYLYSSPSLTGSWSEMNNGEGLWTLLYLQRYSINQSMTAGSVISAPNGWNYCWSWGYSGTDTTTGTRTVTFTQRSLDLINWSPCYNIITMTQSDIDAGQSQWADVWVINVPSKNTIYLYTTKVGGPNAGVHVFTYTGTLQQLVSP